MRHDDLRRRGGVSQVLSGGTPGVLEFLAAVDENLVGPVVAYALGGGADRLPATARFEPAGRRAQRQPPSLTARPDPLLERWNRLEHSLCRRVFQDSKPEIA